jgi:hypothetical protein
VNALAGPFYAVCLLLAVAGAFKTARPAATVGALRAVGLPGSPALVRLMGVGEAVIGLGAVITGWPPLAGLVAVAYAGFAGFVAAALRRGTPLQSCGCFGSVDIPPTRIHLAVDVVASVVAAIAAVTRIDGLAAVLADQPWAGVPFLALVAVTIWFLYLVLTALPAALRA